MIRILVADDHQLIREGLRKVLKDQADIRIVSEASSVSDLLSKLSMEVDLVILDISMPDQNGLEAIRQIHEVRPELRVLVLSMHPEERFAVQAIREGAWGYMTKDTAAGELALAIRKIISGKKYISGTLAETLAGYLDTPNSRPMHENLSSREKQVLCSIPNGRSIKEIATDLAISINTVNTYRNRMLGKMRMKTYAEIVRYA